MQLSLASNAPGVGPSLPYWVCFNQNDDAELDAAATWVQNNLVPAPSAATSVMLGANLFIRRRRGVPR
jgi:hypothetical protein